MTQAQQPVQGTDFPFALESQGWIWDEFWQVQDPYSVSNMGNA
jgi:hypothetical protein